MAKLEINYIRPREVYTPDTKKSKVDYSGYNGEQHEIQLVENMGEDVSSIVNDIITPDPKGNVTFNDADGDTHTLITEKGLGGLSVVKTTYGALKALRDGGKLVEGTLYRITDYVTTTTQANSQSAGHRFDVIVLALDDHTLSEEAYAAVHEGDTYFASSKLEAWKIWYCLDNDTDRFAWADADNGKGVIWRMIDEFNNDIPYDFKNIQFKRYKTVAKAGGPTALDGRYYSSVDMWGYISSPEGYDTDEDDYKWFYTFHGFNSDTDESYDVSAHPLKGSQEYIDYIIEQGGLGSQIGDFCYGNVMKIYGQKDITGNGDYTSCMTLPNNVFMNVSYFSYDDEDEYWETGFARCYSNTFGNDCYNNTFGDSCDFNTFGNSCSSNTFGDECRYNTFGDYCQNNKFGNEFRYNTFGTSCSYNTFGNECSSNTFGDSYRSNTFGDNCYSNTFGNDCDSNTFGDYCQYNTFGDYCESNTFGNNCESNTFGDNCDSNTFGDDCYSNTFGDNCYSNTFGNNCYSNTFGNDCDSNTFGDYCQYNTFGNNCDSNTFGDYCQYNTFGSKVNNAVTAKSYCRYIRLESGVQYVNITTNATTSSSNFLQNIIVGMGIQGTNSTPKVITHPTVNDKKQTTYVPTNSTTIEI